MAFRQLHMQVRPRCAVMQTFVPLGIHPVLALLQLGNMLTPGSYRVLCPYTVHLENSFPHRVNALFPGKIREHLVRPGACRRLNQRPADFTAARVILVFLAGYSCSFDSRGNFGGINPAEQLRIRYFNM
ncbi:hypothetical protein D3C87_1768050 [compost metagenome]